MFTNFLQQDWQHTNEAWANLNDTKDLIIGMSFSLTCSLQQECFLPDLDSWKTQMVQLII